MHRSNAALTLSETLVILFVAFLVLLFVASLLPHGHVREGSRKKACMNNLRHIGKAMTEYRWNHDEHLPFSWMPANAQSPRNKDAMTSIACLYPEYLDAAGTFRCFSTDDEPSFVFNTMEPLTNMSGPSSATNAQNGNFTLTGSSYGYDCRLSPRAESGHGRFI